MELNTLMHRLHQRCRSQDEALILSSKCPSAGISIRIEVLLPSPADGGAELRIECIGNVVRVAQKDGCFGAHGLPDDDHLTCHILH